MTGHIKDPVPPVEKSRESCPGGRFPRFIDQSVIIHRPKIEVKVVTRVGVKYVIVFVFRYAICI